MKTPFSRRRLLTGIGAAIALPSFETFAAEPTAVGQAGLTASGAPLRMAFMSIPNGVQQKHWFPTSGFKLNTSMQPLEPLKNKLQVIGGLGHENATAGRDGAGDHARSSATYLTGARARKTAGRDIFVGQSIDQVAAARMQGKTRFSSLELSCESARNSGSCDSGYACAYQYNLSWSTPTTPVTPESNPRLVFERLFGAGSRKQRQSNLARRQETERSILDFVLEDASSLGRRLSSRDTQKLDAYLEGVRAVEQRIQATENLGAVPNPEKETPSGIPDAHGDHIDLMYDLLATAFETDSTRVATLLLAHDGSNRVFKEIGIREGHHHLTHNQNKEDLAEKVAAIDQFYISHFAKFLHKLSAIEDVDGKSVLDNSMLIYGGAIADGNRHTHDNLPVILAGSAGGQLQTGRFHQAEEQPMSNLFVEMLGRFGAPVDSFGDSNGRLSSI